jgi:hypothetical protein
MDKGFGQLSDSSVASAMLGVIRVSFHKFVKGWGGDILQSESVENMQINTLTKRQFKFVIVSFPHDNLKVGAV